MPYFEDTFRLICEAASRWRYARLGVNASQRQILANTGPKPHLQSLWLKDLMPESGPLFRLQGVPFIQELFLTRIALQWDTLALPSLRRLAIDAQMPTMGPTLSDILEILSKCPNLEVATFVDLKDNVELARQGTQYLLELPNMCELTLMMHVDRAHRLLSHLHTPNCRILSFRTSLLYHALPHNAFDNDRIVRIIQSKIPNEGEGYLHIYSRKGSLEVKLSAEGFTLAMQLDEGDIPYSTLLPSLSHALARAHRRIHITMEIGFWTVVPPHVIKACGLMRNASTLIYRRGPTLCPTIGRMLDLMSSPTFGEEGRFLFHDVSQLEMDIPHAQMNAFVYMVKSRRDAKEGNRPVPFSKIILDQLKTNVEDSEPFIQMIRDIVGHDNVVWRSQ